MVHETHYCFSAMDGISYDFDMEFQRGKSRQAIIYVDINGPKKPNRFGKDRFAFLIIELKILPSKNLTSIIDQGYNNAIYKCMDGKITNDGLSYTNNYGCAYKYIYEP